MESRVLLLITTYWRLQRTHSNAEAAKVACSIITSSLMQRPEMNGS